MDLPDLQLPPCPNCQADQMYHRCVSHIPGRSAFRKNGWYAKPAVLVPTSLATFGKRTQPPQPLRWPHWVVIQQASTDRGKEAIMHKILLTTLGALMIAPAWANELPKCGLDAAAEFGAPVKVLQALAINEKSVPPPPPHMMPEHGPMGLGEATIQYIAGNINSSVESIKANPCENYRAAAWFLMNQSGGNKLPIWEAVNNYYYGGRTRSSYPISEAARNIFDQL